MHRVYDIWPEIAKESYETKCKEIKFNEISHIVFAGMGGSGAIGDIFEAILSKTNIHVTLVKGYHLPNTVNSKTLVIATSISGNTVETLSVLKSAIQTDAKVIAFSSGGELEKICIKNSLEYRKIEMRHSPRVSFPIFLYSMLKILESVLPIKKEDIKESLLELERTKEKINSDTTLYFKIVDGKSNPLISLKSFSDCETQKQKNSCLFHYLAMVRLPDK